MPSRWSPHQRNTRIFAEYEFTWLMTQNIWMIWNNTLIKHNQITEWLRGPMNNIQIQSTTYLQNPLNRFQHWNLRDMEPNITMTHAQRHPRTTYANPVLGTIWRLMDYHFQVILEESTTHFYQLSMIDLPCGNDIHPSQFGHDIGLKCIHIINRSITFKQLDP